ncbi:hypothetical protein [Streptomyces sp. NPDC055210]
MERVTVERSTPNQQASTSCVVSMAQTHQHGQQPVDEDELVLRPSSYRPLPRPCRQACLMPLVPQRPDLGAEFSDHNRRQPG